MILLNGVNHKPRLVGIPFDSTKAGNAFELTVCVTKALPIGLNGLSDADFEGLVSLDDQTFLMVSDDKVGGDLRTVFVMFRLGM